MKKKLLSFILVLAMILSLVPASIFAEDPVIFPNDAEHTYLKWKEGSFLNKQVTGNFISTYVGTPTIIGENIVFAGKENKLFAVDKKKGTLVSQVALSGPVSNGMNIPVTYATDTDMLYVPIDGGKVDKINASTFNLEATYTETEIGGQAMSRILYSDGKLYVGYWKGDKFDAYFCCIDSSTMNELWKYKSYGGFYWDDPILVGDFVVVAGSDSNKGVIYSFKKSYESNVDPISKIEIDSTKHIRSGFCV